MRPIISKVLKGTTNSAADNVTRVWQICSSVFLPSISGKPAKEGSIISISGIPSVYGRDGALAAQAIGFTLPHMMESREATVERRSMTDLPDTGKCPVKTVESRTVLKGTVEGCVSCHKCMKECPEKALEIRKESNISIGYCKSDRCVGTACRRCERVCPGHVLHLDGFTVQM